MIIGLDKPFAPEGVYKILRLSKPGVRYKDLEPTFRTLVGFKGREAQSKALTVIRRYFLNLRKENGIEVMDSNFLHLLCVQYSFESLKPMLLQVLLLRCEIARYIQNDLNIKFGHLQEIQSSVLVNSARRHFGDRRIIAFAVRYYLTILNNFGILSKQGPKCKWVSRRLRCPPHVLKEMIGAYSIVTGQKEIDIKRLAENIAFSLIDLKDLEDVLREHNSIQWIYQKGPNGRKIVMKSV